MPVAAREEGSPQAEAFERLAARVAEILDAPGTAAPGAEPSLLDRFRSVWKPPSP
jgi:hypothetical protein